MRSYRVLGTCYVCGKSCRGVRIVYGRTTEARRGVIVRDLGGVRHGGCVIVAGRPGTVTPADS